MKEIQLYLGGLNCANCAQKIEEKTSSKENINNASLNFIKKTLKFSVSDELDEDEVIESIISIIDGIEPGLDIRKIDDNFNHGIEHSSGGC